MKNLYLFNWDCGRDGDIDGLFAAEEKEVEETIGQEIYFGEILGKHSNIFGILKREDVEFISSDQELINKLDDLFGGGSYSGYNPLYFTRGKND